MAAHQAPPSLGFSRQEHWSGLPFSSPMHESEKWQWSRSVVSDSSSDPMDHSLPGCSFHGIFQARVLEWVAIAFSIREVQFSSVRFCCSVVSDSLRPHELQHTRSPCPSPISGVHLNSCPSSRWCHLAISSSVVPFSSCPQSLPASGSFPMSQTHQVAKVLEFQL